ncbi:MarR family winged helix-turn-helix transcriptional regulator [Ammoniphilus oxalaticus]|uniref:MarR family winged helix-turn-helix transcriptional regulator n=1 Tax=Ammoniphilus oxalaticus TaxID=66863 RepID=UPI001FE8D9A7|nr:MarR family transcriptional regulator [Ammoniphilus oxalaticus]
MLNKELNQVLKKHDLFAAQWSVLYYVNQRGETTLTQIWKYLNVEAPTVTRTVKRLEELGWLSTYTGDDRREKRVRLKADASERLPEILETVNFFERKLMANLTESEQDLLMDLLNKLDNERS